MDGVNAILIDTAGLVASFVDVDELNDSAHNDNIAVDDDG